MRYWRIGIDMYAKTLVAHRAAQCLLFCRSFDCFSVRVAWLLDYVYCIPTADGTFLRISTVIDSVSEHILLLIVIKSS